MGLWPAAVVSGLIFGLFHLDPVMALSTWILGIAAAWAYERSGSLWPAFAMHAVTNFLAQGLSYILLWTGVQ
jgi:membrane protease YdiL (CAAX protease family)